MAAEALITVLVCVALVVLFALGGMSVLKHGVSTDPSTVYSGKIFLPGSLGFQ